MTDLKNFYWVPLLCSTILLSIVMILFLNILSQRPIQTIDPNSGSNFNEIIPEFLDIYLNISFNQQIIEGNVVYNFRSLVDGLDRIILDYKQLKIINVEDPNTKADIKFKSYTLLLQGERYTENKVLIIYPKKKLGIGDIFRVNIFYVTQNNDCLSWLSNQQTDGKTSPLMYSVCQSIHCRAIIPSMDTPSVKAPFNITFNVDLDLVPVASGIRVGDPFSTKPPFNYQQKIPIPIYLFAIAAGNFTYKILPNSDRIGIYAEQVNINLALDILQDSGTYLNIIESKLTPYEWQVYNILILPKNYPMGAMENPDMTFATSIILTPYKNQSYVIPHEINHPWFGNLLTCKTWDHTWLNEGFAMFGQRYLEKIYYGYDTFMASAAGGLLDLNSTINQYGKDSPLTILVQNMKRKDPDSSYNTIAYEKGFTSLYIISEIIGEENMWELLRLYINSYKFESVDSEMFKFIAYNFIGMLPNGTKYNEQIDWDNLLYGKGMHPKTPSFESKRLKDIVNLVSNYINNQQGNKSFLLSLNGYEIEYFMNLLDSKSSGNPSNETLIHLELDGNFTHNLPYSSVKTKWLALNIKLRYTQIKDTVEDYLTNIGWIGFISPIYSGLVKLNINEAIRIYNSAKSFYHPLCRYAIESIIYGN